MCPILHSCTLSIIMNHTEGHATDMVDTNQTASPKIDAKASLK